MRVSHADAKNYLAFGGQFDVGLRLSPSQHEGSDYVAQVGNQGVFGLLGGQAVSSHLLDEAYGVKPLLEEAKETK